MQHTLQRTAHTHNAGHCRTRQDIATRCESLCDPLCGSCIFPITCVTYRWLQIGWHRILRLLVKLFNEPKFCPWGLWLVPRNSMVLMMNLMRILVRLVLNWKFLEIISRFFATLSAVGCIMTSKCVTFLYVGYVKIFIKGPHHCFRAYLEGQTTTTHNNLQQQTATDCNRLQHIENFCVTPDNSTCL